jgi:hypothetical protein
VKRVSKGKKSSKSGRNEKGVGGRSKASGERTSRGCDEGWDGGAIVDGQATIRWRGCRALGIAGGLAGENARKDPGVLQESEERVGLEKKRVELCGRRTRWKESRKERD